MAREKPADLFQSLIQGLSDLDVQVLRSVTRELSFERGAILMKEGDQGQSMMLILEGKVVVLKRANTPNPEVVASRGPGDILGEMNFVSGSTRSATIRAQTDVLVEMFPFDELVPLLAEYHRISSQIAWNLARILATRLGEATTRVWDLEGEVRLSTQQLDRWRARGVREKG
jgi:CRP-like cAMP-binding protein